MPTNPKSRRHRLQRVTLLIKDAATEELKPIQNTWFGFAGDIVKIGVYISILGFLTAHTIVDNQTKIFSVNIAPQQYLMLGGSIALLFFGRILLIPIIALGVLFFLLRLYIVYRRYKKIKLIETLEFAGELMRDLATSGFTWLFIFWWAATYAIHPGDLFAGLNTTNQAPKDTISLIFKEDIDPQLWHLTIDPAHPRHTGPIAIIVEYTDGLLIRDLTTRAIVKVSNDVIAGILDDRDYGRGVLPTVTPSLVSTVAPTITP